MTVDELFYNESSKSNTDFLIYQDHHEELAEIILKIFFYLSLNVH